HHVVPSARRQATRARKRNADLAAVREQRGVARRRLGQGAQAHRRVRSAAGAADQPGTVLCWSRGLVSLVPDRNQSHGGHARRPGALLFRPAGEELEKPAAPTGRKALGSVLTGHKTAPADWG